MDMKKVNEITLTLVDVANTSSTEDIIEFFADDDVQRVEIENGIVRVTFKHPQDTITIDDDDFIVTENFVVASIDSPAEPASFIVHYVDFQDLKEQLDRFAWLPSEVKAQILKLAEEKLTSRR